MVLLGESDLLRAMNAAWAKDAVLHTAVRLSQSQQVFGEVWDGSFEINLNPFRTKDGYEWLLGLSFLISGKRMIVAFPYTLDVKRLDDSPADRSIAIFVDEGIQKDSAEKVLKILLDLIEELS